MNRKLKKALKAHFEPPAPGKREAFFRTIPQPSIGTIAFLCTQAGYIRKRAWGVSALAFSVALAGGRWLGRDVLWWVSALMPLLALSLLTEGGRSEAWGMAEFELSTRFSLKSVVLARLGILGGANLALFWLLVSLVWGSSAAGLMETAVYMACPYLLTAFAGLWALRRVRGTEGVYLCCAIAAGVCAGNLLLHQSFPAVWTEEYVVWWVAAAAALTLGTVRQGCRMVKQTEELAWS